jgi:predicted glutamine amidotransferase
MCRWLAYSGSPILLEELLYKPAYSLIDQSMHARLGATTTNGDGFGVGWYTSRASTGTAVQQTNCHPFRHGRWLWVHNGMIRDFARVKRDLVLAVDPSLYPAIEGSADSEVMFFLALTFGLEHDPPTAVERMVGFVETVAGKQGIKEPLQMTIGTTDGDRVWAFRYSSEGRSRSLFYSTKMHTLRQLYPDNPILHQVAEETRLIVSEPLGDLAGAWNEVPESSYGVVHHGHDELHPFRPRP